MKRSEKCFAGFQCLAFGLDVYEYDVTQLFLSIVGDAYIGYVAFLADPFMFFGVLYVAWKVHDF